TRAVLSRGRDGQGRLDRTGLLASVPARPRAHRRPARAGGAVGQARGCRPHARPRRRRARLSGAIRPKGSRLKMTQMRSFTRGRGAPTLIQAPHYDVIALVLQGGGALGAYQAGVYQG